MGSARDEILRKLRTVVHKDSERPDFEQPIFHQVSQPYETVFKENLELVNGQVYLFDNEEALFMKLKALLHSYHPDTIFCSENQIATQLTAGGISCQPYLDDPEKLEVGITGCEFLVAHTGSVMVSSAQKGGRQLFVAAPLHIVIARKNQLVAYLDEAYSAISKKYGQHLPSQITLITGPSRTADIEKTLVLGAHGPRRLWVFIW